MRHYVFIATSMAIWSTWGLMIRWMALPPVVVLFYTSLVAGMAVPLVLGKRGELDLDGVLSTWTWYVVLLLSSLANNLTYFYALGHTTVSNAVFTHYTAPFFVAVLAPLLIAEPLQKVTLISLPMAIVGLVMIVGSGGGMLFRGEHALGIAAGTASGIAYAVLIIASRKLSRMRMHHKAVVLILWGTALVTAVPALMTPHGWDVRKVGLLVTAGLLHSTVAPLLYYNALRHVAAQYAAILGYLEPLFAVPLALIFLGELPSGHVLVGGALILLSGYFVVRESQQRNRDIQ